MKSKLLHLTIILIFNLNVFSAQINEVDIQENTLKLFKTIDANDFDRVKECLKSPVDLKATDVRGTMLEHVADMWNVREGVALESCKNIMLALLNAGCYPHQNNARFIKIIDGWCYSFQDCSMDFPRWNVLKKFYIFHEFRRYSIPDVLTDLIGDFTRE